MKIKLTFFIKNYEKLILSTVLVIFIISLIWLVNIFYKSQKERNTGITVFANKRVYKKIPKSYYNFNKTLKESILWVNSEKRNLNKKDKNYIVTYTNFMIPFPIARSNAPLAGGKLIPYEYYKIGIDPITKEILLLPKIVVGISSVKPALIVRLILLDITKTKMPLVLKKIIRESKNSEDWDIQINILKNKKWNARFFKIDSDIELNGLWYRITNIVNKVYDRLNPRLGAIVKSDESEIILLDESSGEKIIVKINKPIYEPKPLITIKNLYTNKISKIKINDSIILGNKTRGYESYELIAVDDVNNRLKFSRNNRIYTVKKTTSYIVPNK